MIGYSEHSLCRPERDAGPFVQPLGAPLAAVRQHACGKAIIVGEHAVVYGSRAVAMPLANLQLSVELKPMSGGSKSQLLLNGAVASENLQGVVGEVLSQLGVPPSPVAIHCHSSLPVGAGLGSSASLCIVLLRAVAAASHKDLDPGELARLGNLLERRFHGTPSGLDTAVVAYERAISFRKNTKADGNLAAPTLEFIQVSPIRSGSSEARFPWRFALIDSQVRASTLTMIARAAPYFNHSKGRERIAEFDELSTLVATALSQGCMDTLASAMTTCATLLDAAGVVPSVLHTTMETALDIGVRAAKPTGAGGGGCILALLDPACADKQISALRTHFGPEHIYGVSLPHV